MKLINFNNDLHQQPGRHPGFAGGLGVNPETGINQCDYTYALVDPYQNKAIGYNITIAQVFAGELRPKT